MLVPALSRVHNCTIVSEVILYDSGLAEARAAASFARFLFDAVVAANAGRVGQLGPDGLFHADVQHSSGDAHGDEAERHAHQDGDHLNKARLQYAVSSEEDASRIPITFRNTT